MGEYVIDQAWRGERDRLGSLQACLDPVTTRYLAQAGIGPGRRCLEVGAGAGSIAYWMAEQVGADGSVVAVDLDPRFLLDHGRANLDVQTVDLRTDDLGENLYDVAHARLVLEHLSERDQILENIVRSLRPGGWVLVESLDVDESLISTAARWVRPAEHADLSARCWSALMVLMRDAGGETTYGSRLPDAFATAGLLDVGSSVQVHSVPGGISPHFLALTIEQMRPLILERGLMAPTDVDQILEFFGKAGTAVPFGPMVSVWGRKRGQSVGLSARADRYWPSTATHGS